MSITVLSRSKKPDERERRLKSYLGFLKEDAGWCSNAINKIVQLHVRFASLMAQRIDNASKSQCNLEYDDSETTTIANDISEASDSLSTYVTQIKDNLKLFVSVLEEVQVTMKKEPSWVERIPGWLKSLYKTIASIVATVCSPISALLPSAEPKRKIPLSALGEWAAIFRTADSGAFLKHLCADRTDRLFDTEPQEGKVSESLESLILFLKKIVPREVQDAQEKLERFDEALDIMGLERHMRAGQRVILYGPDLAAVAEEWRDQAKQYQWMLPDNEDPAF
jgi:hypothetical protein